MTSKTQIKEPNPQNSANTLKAVSPKASTLLIPDLLMTPAYKFNNRLISTLVNITPSENQLEIANLLDSTSQILYSKTVTIVASNSKMFILSVKLVKPSIEAIKYAHNVKINRHTFMKNNTKWK